MSVVSQNERECFLLRRQRLRLVRQSRDGIDGRSCIGVWQEVHRTKETIGQLVRLRGNGELGTRVVGSSCAEPCVSGTSIHLQEVRYRPGMTRMDYD